MEQRKKFTAALSLFLVCVILMLYTSYAWLVVSSAPEVRNIETNVGANGSLEIALLNDETYIDPATIRTGVGDSLMAQDPMVSNTTWGNVIDLSAEEYGLQEISLKPSRLNVQTDADGNYVVGDHLLMMADFGADGRVSFISDNMVSGVFAEEKFSFHSEQQTHGVRGIGVAGELSLRQKAYTSAKSLVPMFQASALRSAQNIWQENGPALMNMWEQRMKEMENIGGWNMGYTEVEFAAILDSGRKLLEAYDYVDKGICQAVVGITSAMPLIEDSDFERIYRQASAPNVDAFGLYRNYIRPMGVLPEEFYDALRGLDTARDALAGLIRDCQNTAVGQDGYYHNTSADNILWSIGFWGGYLNGFDVQPYETEAYENLQEDNVLILHGANALTAFTGNYTTSFTWGKRLVEVSTADALESAYLPVLPYLNGRLKALNMTNDPQQADIYDLYGFVIDMAFRCNTTTDLLLQTEQTLRVRETTELPVTQGGGSYLRFRAEDMTTQQLVELMDTIRLGFVDNRGYLVALAKPNVSNYKEDIDESVTAPLYLYEFTVTSDGVIVPGERRSEDTGILPLTQSSPEHLSAIVWMDGDYIDNSMASTVSEGMTGVVNLQFASSADLKPAFTDGIASGGNSTVPDVPLPTDPVEPSEPSTPTAPTEPGELIEYDVYISDIQITSHNAADVLGDGTVSYDAKTNTLTLNGATIEGGEIGWGSSIYAGNGLHLVLGEKSSVIRNAFYGIETQGSLTITGGSLTMQGITGTGIRSYENDMTIACDELTVFSEQQGLTTSMGGGTIYINRGKVVLHCGEESDNTAGSYALASTRTVLGNECHVIASGALQAAHTTPELAPGASGKSRTSATGNFVSGIRYDNETYFEFVGNGF